MGVAGRSEALDGGVEAAVGRDSPGWPAAGVVAVILHDPGFLVLGPDRLALGTVYAMVTTSAAVSESRCSTLRNRWSASIFESPGLVTLVAASVALVVGSLPVSVRRWVIEV